MLRLVDTFCILTLAVFSAALFLVGCDTTVAPEPDTTDITVIEAPPGHVTMGLRSVGSFRIGHLTSSAEEKTVKASILAEPPPTPYACHVSRYRADDPRGAGYYVQTLYLHFPDPVVEAAEGRVGLLRWTRRDTSVPHSSRITRLMECRIPQTREAARKVRDQFNLRGTVQRPEPATPPSAAQGAEPAPKSGGPIERIMDGSIPNDEGFVCVGGMDWTSTEQEYCTDGDGLYFPNLPIEEDHPDDSGGGGGGGDGGGWDPGGDGEGPITDPWPDPIDPIPAPLEVPDIADDFVPLDTLDIDCTDPQGWKAEAYCIASPPSGEHLAEVQNAFDRN